MERTKLPNREKNRIPGKIFLERLTDKIIISFELNFKDLQQRYSSLKEEENITLLDLKLKKISNLSKKGVKPTLVERDKKYLPFSQQLSEIIRTKKKIKNTSQRVNSWTREFRILEEQNKVSYDRIEGVLDWYEKNIGGEYIPVVESGYSFRIKFFRLEDAMNRDKQPLKKIKSKPRYYDGIAYHEGIDGRFRNAAGEIWTD